MSFPADFESLKAPLSEARPCGENLEDTQLLASFDAYRLFGQVTPVEPPPDWREIRSRSLEALGQSKDLRLLAHLAASVLRTDSLTHFLSLLPIAAFWTEQYWEQVYPLIDEDAILRKNAFNNFADRPAIIDRLRTLPFIHSRQLGSLSLRDMELASGRLPPVSSDTTVPSQAEVAAAFASVSVEDLGALKDCVTSAIAAIKRIESKMRDAGGTDAAPNLEALSTPLAQIQRIVAEQLAGRGVGEAVAAGEGADVTVASDAGAVSVGAIRSRQDAVHALDQVANFFRKHEPSSPVPMLLDRAKRLVAKDFLEVLADIAPDALGQARAVGGVKDKD